MNLERINMRQDATLWKGMFGPWSIMMAVELDKKLWVATWVIARPGRRVGVLKHETTLPTQAAAEAVVAGWMGK